MAGNTAAEAVSNYIEPFNRALSCVSQGQVRPSNGGYDPAQNPHALSAFARIKLIGSRYELTVAQNYEIIHVPDDKVRGPWRVRTLGYAYEVFDDDFVMGYHWHPTSEGVLFPHLHWKVEHEHHLPTGRVAFEDVILCLLGEPFNVPEARANAKDVLGYGRERFEMYRSWSASSTER